MHRFLAIAALDELGRQPIEQWLIGRLAAQLAEVAGRLLQAFAEMPLPQPIDRHPGEQRILLAVSQSENASTRPSRKSILAVVKGPAGLDGIILFGPLRIAAGQDVTLLALQSAIDLHGPERRQIPDHVLLAQLVQFGRAVLCRSFCPLPS